jgi:DNA polymerase-1
MSAATKKATKNIKEKKAEPGRVCLIDGSGYIFRAYYGLPPMTRPDGTPVNAVYGFTSMLLRLMDDENADYIAVIFDTARVTFRNDIYPDYKANRDDPPDDLIPQFALIREATLAMGLPSIEKAGFEADDLIATYARAAAADGHEVTIVSSDKDLMQLVGERITMHDPMKNIAIGHDQVVEKFGVGPDKVVDVQALAGDSTDNVPGVPGIGIKTAALLINEYGDLDSLLERAGEIKQTKRRENLIEYADLARVSRELVRLRDDVEVADTLASFAVREADADTLLAFLTEQGFRSIIARESGRLAGASSQAAPVAAPVAKGTAKEGGKAAAKATAKAEDGGREAAGYALIQDEAALKDWVAAALGADVLAIDTETTSLDSLTAELVGISLALARPVGGARACYIPLGHVNPATQGALDLGLDLGDGGVQGGKGSKDGAPKQIALKSALKLLTPVMADRGVLKIGHNIKYDAEVLARYGLTMAPVDDTMLLSYVLDGGRHGHGLDELALLHLDRTNIKYSEVTGTGKNRIGFAEVALDKALDYAAEDADVTLGLHEVLKPRLAREHMVAMYETIERPLVAVLEEMEENGIEVDAAELKRLSRDFDKRGAVLAEDIIGLAGREFNIASPKQLGEVLFDEMGMPGGKKGKTGAYGTGADVLEKLAAQGNELPKLVLDWRQLAKLKSTYTDALVQQINPATGRVHTSFAQAVASTGRLSSSDPNLQNIPIRTEEGRKIRKAFIAGKGNLLLSADYSQIELRLLAHVADIKPLKEAFRNGADIHAITASEVFGIPVDGMDPAVRNRAKAINFGIIYGISPFGLARQLDIPQGEARDYIDNYFAHYPGIRDYMERTKEFARENGFVTTMFGRRCHLPGIKDKNPARRNFHERAAINAPLQGAAADIIKRAMIRMPGALKRARLKARMLLQVHDELVFEVPEGELDKTADLVRGVMENAAQLDVPLVCDTAAAANWAEAH